jgi:hypothetical protein
MPEALASDTRRSVRHFRQILLWPLQLMPIHEAQIQKHWECLEAPGGDNPWQEVEDEFTGDPRLFQERHYSELVTFLPCVQRFLYGEARGSSPDIVQESPIRVFRRGDVARVRLTSSDPQVGSMTFEVAHVDLYFFYDIDVAILAMEFFADNLSLSQVQDTLFRFGRSYPTYWEPAGGGGHCPKYVEWLSKEDKVLAVSDYEKRDKYLAFVCRYRAPCIASHWEWLLDPLVLHHSGRNGIIRYRQIEYHLMPLMAYVVMDDPATLTRAEFVRLALAASPGSADSLPYSDRHLANFEGHFCYDRYWNGHDHSSPGTRFMCSGRVFTMVGDSSPRNAIDRKTDLEQFRHEYFVLFLLAHFHKAALLMFEDRLVDATNRLDVSKLESVRQFRRVIRRTLGIFLRFTQRYWFHEVSDHTQAKELFRLISDHLGTARLYSEVRTAIEDMSQYLDSDALRRQGETMVRLTVVTTFGLIGVTATGFLGMNLFALADSSALMKLVYFAVVLIPSAALTLFLVLRSRRLSDLMEMLADERCSARGRLAAFMKGWKRFDD